MGENVIIFCVVFFRSKLYSAEEEDDFPYDTVLTNLLCFFHILHVILAQYELLGLVFPVILVLLYSFCTLL